MAKRKSTNGQTTIYETYKNWRCESDVDTDSDPINLCSYSVSFIEEANNLCIAFDVTLPEIETTIYHTRGPLVNHYNIDTSVHKNALKIDEKIDNNP
jgi:hypothetical protein